MVEDIEESVLGPLTDQILDIVHNQDLNLHIECKEICEFVLHIDCIHILGLELVSCHIQNYLLRELLLDGKTYGLGDMSLSKA